MSDDYKKLARATDPIPEGWEKKPDTVCFCGCCLRRITKPVEEKMKQYTQEEFEGAILKGERDFSHCSFENLDLTGTQEAKRDLTRLDFSHSKIKRINFSYADLSRVDFNHCCLRECNFEGATFISTAIMRAEVLRCNFEGATIDDFKLHGSYIEHCSFKNLDLKGTDFSSAYVIQNDFTGAKTRRCDWANARTLNNVGKKWVHFQAFDQEPAVYHEGFVQVACQNHSVRNWIGNYSAIGARNDWSAENIEIYGDFFRKCYAIWEKERASLGPVPYLLTNSELEHIFENAEGEWNLKEFLEYMKTHAQTPVESEVTNG
jgi:uncharacterized protein YjbI with pentapeptide repeats